MPRRESTFETVDSFETSLGQARRPLQGGIPVLTVDNHRLFCFGRELLAAGIELGQQDVFGVYNVTILKLLHASDIDQRCILAVDQLGRLAGRHLTEAAKSARRFGKNQGHNNAYPSQAQAGIVTDEFS